MSKKKGSRKTFPFLDNLCGYGDSDFYFGKIPTGNITYLDPLYFIFNHAKMKVQKCLELSSDVKSTVQCKEIRIKAVSIGNIN